MVSREGVGRYADTGSRIKTGGRGEDHVYILNDDDGV